METLMIATIIFCILITLIEVIGTIVNPISGLHNLPKDIQERVHSLPYYKGKLGKILSIRERIQKKLPALMVLITVFAGIVYAAGARSFWQGFGYAFLVWAIVKLYITVVIMCGWYAHSPSRWIPGTEDMKDSYRNYKFYLSGIPRSLFAGAIVGVVIGGMIQLAL